MENLLLALFGAGWVAWSSVCVLQGELGKRRRRRLAAAWQLANDGAIDEARREFRVLVQCRDRRVADIARWGLAWLQLSEAEYHAAAEAFAALRDDSVLDDPWRRSFFAEAVAICRALAGDVGAADAALAEATDETQITPKVQAILACRRARFETAAGIDVGDRDDHDAHACRILRGFALHSLGDDRAADALAGVEQHFAGEFDYLAARWPALRAFLDDHALPVRPGELPSARVV